MARSRSPGASNESLVTEGGAPASGFGPVGPLSDRMEVGFLEDLSPKDSHMVDVVAASLKHSQSPPKPPNLNVGVSSSSSMLGSSSEGSTSQVSPSAISVIGAQGERVLLLVIGLGRVVSLRFLTCWSLLVQRVLGRSLVGTGARLLWVRERCTAGGSGISYSSSVGDVPSSPPSLATTIPTGGLLSLSPTSPLVPCCGGGKVVGGKDSNLLIRGGPQGGKGTGS